MSAPIPVTVRESSPFWKGYWVTLRPYLFFVSGASGLLGLALAGPMGGSTFLAASAVFFLSYGLGQALTDVFQVDTDSLSSPYRPLVRGQIRRGAVLGVSLAGLAVCAAVLTVLNPWTLPLTAAGVVGLVLYTPLKRRFWGGPPWNAGVVALLPAIGLLCGVASPVSALAHPLLLPATASVFFSYAVFVLLGYFKDIEADRGTGYETLPVRFGRRVSVRVSALFLSAAAVASWILVRHSLVTELPGSPRAWLAAAVWFSGIGLMTAAHLRMLRVTRDDAAYVPILLAVRGYVALHLGEASLLAPRFVWLVIPIIALFEYALASRPFRAQV
ncbi:MAG: UbiA family prenyltransferase [Thermoanaerobaculia bacterium]